MAKIFGYHTTEKGTKLPLLDLKGKAYLQVAHRLVLFREKYPMGILKTQLLSDQNDEVTFRAEVYVPAENGQPMLIATGHKSENRKSFQDHREKAETGSVGRALALAGIGTQFCEVDLDEADRIVDSPLSPVTNVTTASTTPTVAAKATAGRASSFRKKVGGNGDDI